MALNAITSTTRRVQYTGNNSTTSFAFTFVIESASDIAVYFDGTKKTLTTHYTVTVGSDGTGSITTTTGNTPGTGVLVTIIGNRSISRTTEFTAGGPLTAASLENELNSQTLLISQLSERIDRCFTLPINTDATTPLELPYNNTEASNANRILKFNSAGTAFELGSTTTNIDTLAGIASDITTVSGISSNVTTVAADGTDIGTVAGISSNVTTVAGISSDVTSVAGIASNVTTVAGKASLITSDFAADMSLVTSDFVSDMALVTADFISDVNTLATTDIVNDLNLLATSDFVSDLNTLATSDFVSDLNALEAIKANVTTVANNISDVNNFASIYRIGTSDPTSSLDEGDLFYNSTDNVLKFYNGSAWASITAGIANVVEDTTPQLGGNLDAQTNNITNLGTVNTHTIPSGTGTFALTSDITFTASSTDTLSNKTISTSNNTISGLVSETGSTGSAEIPVGTTAQRDGSPATGMFRFNSTTTSFEGYNGSSWGSVGGGATGGGGDEVFVETDVTVSTSYTLSSNKNALTVGPITISAGATVTVPSGQRWLVL